MKLHLIAVILLHLSLFSLKAKAQSMSFEVTGTVEEIFFEDDQGIQVFPAEFSVGDPIQIFYTFDSNARDVFPDDSTIGRYGAVEFMDFTIGTFAPNDAAKQGIIVVDLETPSSRHTYNAIGFFFGTFVSGFDFELNDVSIVLSDSSQTAFTSDELPLLPPNLGDFDFQGVVFEFPSNTGGFGFGCVKGSVESISLVELDVLGDVNCDGVVNLLDVEPFVSILSSGQFEPKADINQDGAVNLLDISGFIDLLAG